MSVPRPVLLLILVGVLAGCATDVIGTDDIGTAAGATAGTASVEGEIVVQAAASLTDAFPDVATAFGEDHPGATVVFNFAGSQALATQIVQGAPADVFASANHTQMDVVADEGLVAGEPEVFTSNVLAIAVESGNPFGITSLTDLADPDLVVVLAAPAVPAGTVAAQALESAAVEVAPASLEVDVRAVLSKVELGEADAGIVYASDLVTAGESVEGVTIPQGENVVAEYPIAALGDAPNPDGAAAFVTFILSDEGRAILEAYGFVGA